MAIPSFERAPASMQSPGIDRTFSIGMKCRCGSKRFFYAHGTNKRLQDVRGMKILIDITGKRFMKRGVR